MAEGAESSGKMKHIVADSAAFLKNAPLHEMCENVYTVEDVVNEIRDATTRQRLSVLPYNIQFREPSSEALHAGKLNLAGFYTITVASKVSCGLATRPPLQSRLCLANYLEGTGKKERNDSTIISSDHAIY